MLNAEAIKLALAGKCPKCKTGDMFQKGFTLELNDKCPSCGLNLQDNDSADGPAVFMIFILGFALAPLALWLDAVYEIPLWAHAVLWGGIALFLTLGMLKPLKAYVIALQFKYRPDDWD